MMKKLWGILLALVLCLVVLGAHAETQTVTITANPQVELPENDELFAMYAEGQFYGVGGISFFGRQAGDTLTGVAKDIYDALKPQVEDIAAGRQTSTTILLETSSFDTVPVYAAASQEEFVACFGMDIDKALDALLMDCPYELFWYDKISKTQTAMSFYVSGNMYTVDAIQILMPVAGGYAASTYVVNELPAKVAKAAANARQLVAANEGKTDLEKLEAYKNYICNAVTYDHDAADADDGYFSTNIDPWQLISVFDGVSTTNVVCEGYSKAFQYLCDLSDFDDVECYIVSGVMAGGTGAGRHMWNIVKTGGKNYLVDVTNSDEDTVGEGGTLFMAKAASGSVDEGYVLMGDYNTPITFTYDNDLIWSNSVLTLAMEVPVAAITKGGTTTPYMTFEDALDNWTDGTTLTLLDSVSYDDYIDLGAGTRTFVGGVYTLDLGSSNLENDGTLTINGGTITADYMEGGTITNWGELIINGNSVISNSRNAAVLNFNEFEATGGTLTASPGFDNEDDGIAVLNGTTLNNVLTWGDVTLINCTITPDTSSDKHIDFRGGKVTISGDCAGWRVICLSDNSAVVGTDIVLPDNYYLFRNAVIIPTLENHAEAIIGKHTSADHNYEYTPNGDGLTHDITCTAGCGAGEKSVAHTAPDAEGKCVCGAQLVAQVDEAYYSDIAVAMDDWANNGGTMTLLDDVTVTDSLQVNTLDVMLDLNGNDIVCTDNIGIYVSNSASLVLLDSSTEAGTIYATDDSGSDSTAIVNDGVLTIDGGKISAVNGVRNNGILEMNGGTIKADFLGVDNWNSATVNGGSIDSSVVGIYNEGSLKIVGSPIVQNDTVFSYLNGTIDLTTATIDADGWKIWHSAEIEGRPGDATIKLPANHYFFVENKLVNSVPNGTSAIIQQHSHNYTATADDDTDIITYACTCGIDTQTAKLLAPAGDLVYNGMAYIPTVELTGSTIEPAVAYTQNGQGVAEIKNAGDYTATINWHGKEVSVDFTILPADIADATVTVVEETYTGFSITPTYTVSMNEERLGQNTDFTVTFPADMTNAGSKELIFTGIGNYTGTKTVALIINKATPTVTPPEALPELTYTGHNLALVIPGRTSGGTMLYSLDGQEWNEEVPRGIDVGEYTVYYKVDGGTNYESVEAQSLTVSIGKGLAYLLEAPTPINRTYDGTQQPLVNAGNADGGKLVYSLEENGTYTEEVPAATNAGDYTVWYYVQGGDNYHDSSDKAFVQVTIAPIMLEVDANDAAYAKIYDGTTSIATVVWKQSPFLGDGLLPGADVQLMMDAFPAYTTSKMGSYDAEIGVALQGEDAQNYKLTADKVTVTAIIEPKPLTATAVEGSRAYDATAKWIAPLEMDGIIGSDDVSGMADFQLSGINVGEYTEATLWAEPELTGADAGNYTIEPEGVTFTKATITKAAADKWSFALATPQDVLVGSGLNAVIVPATGTGIGDEVVEVSVSVYSDAAMQTAAKDADISTLAEGESVTLYYKADTENYEDLTGAVVLNAIDHQHEWTYTADEDTNTITATCSGTIGTCPDAEQSLTLTAPDANYSGERVEAEVTREGMSLTYTLQYSPNAPITAGDYTVTMFVGDKSVSDTFTINPKDISVSASCQFSLNETSFVYTGKAPELSVTAVDNGVGSYTMQEGTDYTVGTVEVNAGNHKLTITGMGNYTGSYTLDYEITRAPIDAAVITADDQVYTGEALEPDFTVTLDGKELKHNDEYVFELSDNVNVGDGKIVITGVGNYEGQAEGTFAITMSGAEVTAEADKAAYTYGEAITVTATRAATGAAPATFALRSAPAADQMAVFLGDTQVSDAVSAVNGTYTMTINTADKELAIGSNTLRVVYMSNGNLSDAEAKVTVTLNQKELTIISVAAADREYIKGNKLVAVTGVELDGIVVIGDDVAADLTGVQGTLEADKAGDYTTLALPQLTLTGSEKDYYTIAADEEVTTAVTIRKAKLTGVEKPVDSELTSYYATADQVAAELDAQAKYTLASGEAVLLNIAWSCDDYNATPSATNTFTWTVNDPVMLANYALADGVPGTGTIIVTNGDALPVEVTGSDATITYDETAYDVKQMFTIDANAGAASYEVAGGTGEGTLNGTALTITKAGTFTIKVTTAPNGEYAASETTAVLTVNKADPTVTVPTGLTAQYGQQLSDVALPTAANGVWSWTDEAAPVGDAGTQSHEAIFTPNNTQLWNVTTHDVTITVEKAAASVGEIKLLNGSSEASTFTYGDTITVEAKVTAAPATFSLRALIAPKNNQMALFIRDADGNEMQISDAVSEENGVYTMTYDTKGKALSVGENTLLAKFVGDENTADHQQEVTLTLNRKRLTVDSLAAMNRAYKPGDQQVDITEAEVSGKADANDDVAVDIDAAKASLSSANVGTYDEATLPATVPLAGIHADYYYAEGSTEVAIPQGVEITQAIPQTVNGQSAKPTFDPIQQEGKTLGDIPVSMPEGTFQVPGTIAWVDPSDTPVEEGKPYTWVFTPNDPNWAPVSGTVVIYPEGEPPVITAPTAAQTVEVAEGKQGTLTITAQDAAGYQWYINRNDGKGYVLISGATAASYTTSAVNPDNDGFTYYCVASNAYGQAESPVFTLQVIEEVEIPATGDETNLTMWLALMLLSLLGMAATMLAGRKKANN